MNVIRTRQYTIRESITVDNPAEIPLWRGKELVGVTGRCTECGKWASVRISEPRACVRGSFCNIISLGLVPLTQESPGLRGRIYKFD